MSDKPLCKLDGCAQPLPRAGLTYCSRPCWLTSRAALKQVERLCKAGRHYYTGTRCRGCANEGAARRRGQVLPEVRAAKPATPRPTPSPDGELVWRPSPPSGPGPIVRYPDGSERPATTGEIGRWRVIDKASFDLPRKERHV